MNTGYLVADRLIDLIGREQFRLNEYMKKWEISRRVVFRDMAHLRLFYDVDFKYDPVMKVYRRFNNA